MSTGLQSAAVECGGWWARRDHRDHGRRGPGASPVVASSVSVAHGSCTTASSPDPYRRAFLRVLIPRRVWVNDRLAKRASSRVRSAVEFTAEENPASRREVRLPGGPAGAAASRSAVDELVYDAHIAGAERGGRKLLMQQPAWDNNTWGYDALNALWARRPRIST